jgi:hypothetical protein
MNGPFSLAFSVYRARLEVPDGGMNQAAEIAAVHFTHASGDFAVRVYLGAAGGLAILFPGALSVEYLGPLPPGVWTSLLIDFAGGPPWTVNASSTVGTGSPFPIPTQTINPQGDTGTISLGLAFASSVTGEWRVRFDNVLLMH